MSQQATTEESRRVSRRYTLVLVLYVIAWLMVALGRASGLGFAPGGCLLVVCGLLALFWRREMRSYQGWYGRGVTLPDFLVHFIVVGWGVLTLLVGGMLIAAAAL